MTKNTVFSTRFNRGSSDKQSGQMCVQLLFLESVQGSYLPVSKTINHDLSLQEVGNIPRLVQMLVMMPRTRKYNKRAFFPPYLIAIRYFLSWVCQ